LLDRSVEERVCAALLDCLNDSEVDIRRCAADALIAAPAWFDMPVEGEALLGTERDEGMRRTLLVLFVERVRENDPRLLAALLEEVRGNEVPLSARLWAAHALRRFGVDAQGAIPALKELAEHYPAQAARDACEALTHLGEAGWRVIEDVLASGGPASGGFVKGLGDVAVDDRRAAARLLRMAVEDSEWRRIMAIQQVGGLEGAGEVLEQVFLHDSSVDVRCAAIDALRLSAGNEQLVRVCARAAVDESEAIRAHGSIAEKWIGFDSPGSLRALKQLIKDENAEVRRWAEARIGRINDSRDAEPREDDGP
jgi:hypothetical protein